MEEEPVAPPRRKSLLPVGFVLESPPQTPEVDRAREAVDWAVQTFDLTVSPLPGAPLFANSH